MSKHTPGPWTARKDGSITSPRNNYVVATLGTPLHVGDNVQDANARLIAAAPDLLAVLKSLVINDGRISGVNLGALKPAVVAAIQKAEGGDDGR